MGPWDGARAGPLRLSVVVRPVSTGLPAGAFSAVQSVALEGDWALTSSGPGAWAHPREIVETASWRPAVVPGTVASAIGPEDLDAHTAYHSHDWWYRCRFAAPAHRGGRYRLRFDGLATLAQVWLNGDALLSSDNMFVAREVEVSDSIALENELVIAFRSLDAALGLKRPRPRWKTKLVDHQQLRWFRTTLLGRIPGWTPAVQPVGPWRGVWLETVDGFDIPVASVQTGWNGREGLLDIRAEVSRLDQTASLQRATVQIGATTFEVPLHPTPTGWTLEASLSVPGVKPWWPATHGSPHLYDGSLLLETSSGVLPVALGRLGFRSVRFERDPEHFGIVVNGTQVFCRGSCWTTNDVISLEGDHERMRDKLRLLAQANGNMVRVGGTMVYESEEFYRACDELGIMVWQDMMFANMDYPLDDPAFAASARTEIDQQLRRLAHHPSVVTICGSSEVEQQAAMFGAAKSIWSHSFFSESVRDVVSERSGAVGESWPYWPSTPSGGALPFHVGEGLTHYYGLGAYRRPLDDVRLARVRFTPECLGFSHIPDTDNLRRLTPDGSVPPHDPNWKRGVPRDSGPGWDFEDVRDHYLERLYDVDAVELRSQDLERYLALSRLVTGEVMSHAYGEWRRTEDPCAGALTWFWNDLRPGAGWGVLDSDGRPKAAYYWLRRAWAPRCIRLLDRGLDGLAALLINDANEALDCILEVVVVGRHGILDLASTTVHVDRASTAEVLVEQLFGRFLDPTYSYRFGPPRHEAIAGRLVTSDGATVLSEDVYRPVRQNMSRVRGLSSSVSATASGLSLALTSDQLLNGVHIDVAGHAPDDNYFALTPGRPKIVTLHRLPGTGTSSHGHVDALNLDESVRLSLPTPSLSQR